MMSPQQGSRNVIARFCTAAAVLVMLLGWVPAGAEDDIGGIIVSTGAGEILTGGQLVSISWQGVPAGTEELEILLFTEGSEHHLRLTRMLAPETRSYPWQVPNLPGIRARLVLRFGRDGVEHECEPSRPFMIVPSLSQPVSPIMFRAGEWWVGSRHDPSMGAASLTTSSDDDRLTARLGRRAVAVLPEGPQSFGDPGQPAGRKQTGVLQGEGQQEERYGLPRQPMDVPLRP